MFEQYDDSWIENATKDELRSAIDETYAEMCKYEMFSPEYNEIEAIHAKLVTAWSTYPTGKPPRHREHGWYLPNDDDD